jgi:hypothetical protein
MRRQKATCNRQFARVHLQLLLALGMCLTTGLYAAPTLPAPGDIEDPIAPFPDPKPRTELEQDHLDAIAHFAAGRMAQQRDDHASALREYQRAARLDPNAILALKEIS